MAAEHHNPSNGVPGPVSTRSWALPDAAADDPGASSRPTVPLTAAAVAVSAHPSDPSGSARPPVPFPLTPLTVSDLLDGAWQIITCRPRTVFGISALVMAPTTLVGSLLVRRFGDGLDVLTVLRVFYPYVYVDGRPSPGWPEALLAVAVLSLGTMLLGTALARLVAGWYDGRELTALAAVGQALRRAPALLGAFAVLAVPKALAVAAFLLPAWFLFPFVLLVAPVIAIEDAGPLRAIRRSASLVGRRYVAVLAIWTIWLVSERIVSIAIGFLPGVLATFTPDVVDQYLEPAGWALVLFFTAPAVVGLSTVLYFDLRVRTEGLDLEREAEDVFAGG